MVPFLYVFYTFYCRIALFYAQNPSRLDIIVNMNPRIMVVDDDRALSEMLGLVLQSEGFSTEHAFDGLSAVEMFRAVRPDLVLLDLMLPGIDGVQVCQQIRQESGVPVIMLTARSDTADIVEGLEAGADDYMRKPFKPAELIARVRARLRDPQVESGEVISIGDVRIDVSAHEVIRGEQKIALTPLEFNLLLILARNPQQVFTRELLLEKVWGYQYKADTRLVNVHVQRLRAKIEIDPDQPTIVNTVRGVGYRAGAATA